LRNQPKYHFFKNTTYALNGLKDIVQHETSFKIEMVIAVILLPVIVAIDLSLSYKLFMFMSLMGMLMAEVTNSAIERVVDLVTLEHHEMAGRAKDVGSTIVFFSIGIFVVVWAVCLAEYFALI
jgi:diacylglycerol kinase (ATP)